jgi:hypothetical protein
MGTATPVAGIATMATATIIMMMERLSSSVSAIPTMATPIPTDTVYPYAYGYPYGPSIGFGFTID